MIIIEKCSLSKSWKNNQYVMFKLMVVVNMN